MTNENAAYALITAVRNGNINLAKNLLAEGSDPNVVDEDGSTALMFAANDGNLELIEALLAKGAHLDITNKDGWTAPMLAFNSNRTEVVEEFKKRGINDEAMHVVNQSFILKKIQTYLHSNERDENFIKQFEIGYCSGIASLWLYAKWLQTQAKATQAQRDDYDWFKSTVRLITNWDGIRELSPEENANFERFISQIEYFQYVHTYLPVVSQGDLNESLQDTNGRRLNSEYSIASFFTLNQLKELLKTKNIIQEGKLILISSHNHDTALFKQDGLYYYFDPNSPVGEVKLTSTDELAELIFGANSYDASKRSPIALKMFSFYKGTTLLYPPQQKVLDDINSIVSQGNEEVAGSRLLHFAIMRNSIESVKYFLRNGADPNEKNKSGLTAIELVHYRYNDEISAIVDAYEKNHNDLIRAAKQGNFSIVDNLIKQKNICIYRPDKNGQNALMWAARKGHTKIVDLLIEKTVITEEDRNKAKFLIGSYIKKQEIGIKKGRFWALFTFGLSLLYSRSCKQKIDKLTPVLEKINDPKLVMPAEANISSTAICLNRLGTITPDRKMVSAPQSETTNANPGLKSLTRLEATSSEQLLSDSAAELHNRVTGHMHCAP